MKKNLPLLIGISLPIVFIFIISLVVFAPSWSVHPKYNFVYTLDDYQDSYYYNQRFLNFYQVKEKQLVKLPVVPTKTATPNTPAPMPVLEAPNLYLYNVENQTAHEISFQEAQKYILDPGPSSPDGYNITYLYSNAGIFELFGSSSDNDGLFITNGKAKKKLTGFLEDRYWRSGDFKLLGWVK